jgi:hypothetical protein
MDKIIQTLRGMGDGFEYLVLGVLIAIGIIVIGSIFKKYEAHRATTKYSKHAKIKPE